MADKLKQNNSYILIDTHIALWALTGDSRLPKAAQKLIENYSNDICVSVASLWEVCIKHEINPENMGACSDFFHACRKAGFEVLEISANDVLERERLSLIHCKIHNDPFDHLLISQASARNMMLLTHDKKFEQYNQHFTKSRQSNSKIRLNCVIEVV